MMLASSVREAPERAAINAAMLARRAGKGAGAPGMGDYVGTGEELDVIGGTVREVGSSASDSLIAALRGGFNLLTAVLSPPAYRSTGPGGTTEIRYPNVPSTIPGYPSTAVVPGTGITNTTIMIIAAAVVGLMLMSRGR